MTAFLKFLLMVCMAAWPAGAAGLNLLVTTDRDRITDGEAVMWNVLVSNEAGIPATDVAVRITLPTDMGFGGEFTPTLADYTAFNPFTNPTFSHEAGSTVVYNIPVLATGASRLFQIILKPAPRAFSNKAYVMNVQADAANGVSNAFHSASVLYFPNDGNSFMISGGAVKMLPGVPINFTASFGTTTVSQSNVSIEMNFPPGTVLVSSTGGYQLSGNVQTRMLGNIGAVTNNYQFSLMYTGTDPAGTLIAVTGALKSGNTILSASTWPLAISAETGLVTSAVSPLKFVSPSGTVAWQVRVTNQSNVTANGVLLRVTLPDSMGFGQQFLPKSVSPSAFSRTPTFNSYYDAGTVVAFDCGNMIAGSSQMVQISLKPAFSSADGRSFTMMARADSANGIPTAESQGSVNLASSTHYRSVIAAVPDQTTPEDTPITISGITISDVDTPPTDFVMTAFSNNAALLPTDSVVVTGTGASRSVTATPVANAHGTAYITLQMQDGATQYFKLTVSPVNDAPAISSLAGITIPANTTSAAIPFSVSDPDTTAESLTVTGTSSNLNLLPLSGIIIAGSGDSRTVSLRPSSTLDGAATVTLTVGDGESSISTTFLLTVTAALPYDNWKYTNFGADYLNPDIAGDLANPDGDGLPNLLEYAFGGLPGNATSSPLPAVSKVGEKLKITFFRIPANIQLTYAVQAAGSLEGPWADIARSTAGGTTAVVLAGAAASESGTGTTRTVEVTDSVTMQSPGNRSRYLRVKVTK